jgi:hypothetical protein
MQKTTIQNICDDCSKQVREFSIKIDNKDLCLACVLRRVAYSATILPIGAKCPACKGKGNTREYYGHNDYNNQECKFCVGSGQAQFNDQGVFRCL